MSLPSLSILLLPSPLPSPQVVVLLSLLRLSALRSWCPVLLPSVSCLVYWWQKYKDIAMIILYRTVLFLGRLQRLLGGGQRKEMGY